MSYRTFLAIGRDGSSVFVDVETMLSGIDRPRLRLTWGCASELAAELLANRLREQRDKLVEAAVAKAYADGYRDGRAKRGKRTWHDNRLGRDIP